ncbi:19151_t:CDS:1, partial [Racocetra fulgida]
MTKSSENIPHSTPSTSSNVKSAHQNNQPNNNITPSVSNSIEDTHNTKNTHNIKNTHQDNQPNDNAYSVKRKRSEEIDDLYMSSLQTRKDKHVNVDFENQSKSNVNQDEKSIKFNDATQKNSTRNRKK